LDKIIERAETAQAPAPPSQPASGSPAGGWTLPTAPLPQQQPWGGGHHGKDYGREDDCHEGRGHGRQHGQKRKSWLGELFD
jgi:Zn-finger nucleic acid-binding protein